jgi:hypothetical protein
MKQHKAEIDSSTSFGKPTKYKTGELSY